MCPEPLLSCSGSWGLGLGWKEWSPNCIFTWCPHGRKRVFSEGRSRSRKSGLAICVPCRTPFFRALCRGPTDVACCRLAGLGGAVKSQSSEALWAGDEGCILTGCSLPALWREGRTDEGGHTLTWLALFPWVTVPFLGSSSSSSEPWTMAFSKSSKRKFFYNKKTKDSTYELPAEAIAPFQ